MNHIPSHMGPGSLCGRSVSPTPGFSGGSTYAVGVAIDTAAVPDPAPQDVYQTGRYGDFSYALAGLTPGASYAVQFDYAETYWAGPGQRVFNVAINGALVQTNFDIFIAAGGRQKAIAPTFAAVADSEGKMAIAFTSVVDNATVSGIRILSAATPRRLRASIITDAIGMSMDQNSDGRQVVHLEFSTDSPIDVEEVGE